MEVLVSAVLGDVISRSISFFMDRYHRLQTGGAEESLQQLRRVLLRIQATVEEAERRHITNQTMLRQLEMLTQHMYRGYYMLDAFRRRSHGDGDATAKDEVGPPGTGNISALPTVGPARVGKSTLVEHVCYDERVRDYFSSIVFFNGDDLEASEVNAL